MYAIFFQVHMCDLAFLWLHSQAAFQFKRKSSAAKWVVILGSGILGSGNWWQEFQLSRKSREPSNEAPPVRHILQIPIPC